MRKLLKKTLKKYSVFLFFLAYFILGMLIVKDYGISIDEPAERTTSHAQYKTAYSKILSLLGKKSELIGSIGYNQDMLGELRDRNYGTFLHWPLVTIEHITGFTMDSKEVFLLRHIQTFIYFYLSSIALYIIVKKRTSSRAVGLLASLLLILSPRFFAESFYNNKDILFASWYIFSIYFSLLFLEKKSFKRALIASIIIGIAINTRITAVIIPILLTIWSLISVSLIKKDKLISSLNTLFIPIASVLIYVLTMPTAWGNEINFLASIFREFSQYGWQGSTLYFGNLVPYNNVPWHYTLGYLFITTPIWHSLLFLGGFLTLLKQIIKKIKNPKKFFSSQVFQKDALILTLFILPLVAVTVFKSVLYNSWRHMYFIYGPFIYISTLFLHNYKDKIKYLLPITYIVLIINAVWIFNHHPHQYLYFNLLARSTATQNFERDYWGVGTIELINHILTTDDRSTINIYKEDYSQKSIELSLNKHEKSRFNIVDDPSKADYQTYWYFNSKESRVNIEGFTEIKNITVDGNKGMSLYKRIPSIPLPSF